MNPELLKYYQALQPFFGERMGEWQANDPWYSPETGLSGVITLAMIIPKSHVLRIPRTIDDSSPEAQARSLWGMVDWGRWNIYVFPEGVSIYDHKAGANKEGMNCATPTEAILKALCAQEGVEI